MRRLFFADGGRQPSDPSLKKLRNRLLYINIISLAIVVVLSMLIVYFATFTRVQNEIDERLREIPPGVAENIRLWHGIQDATNLLGQDDGVVSVDGGVIVGGGVNFPVDYDKSFVANVLPDGQITVFSLIEMSDWEYFGSVQMALAGVHARKSLFAEDKMQGGPLLIRGETWNYKVVTAISEGSDSTEYQTSVVFLNTAEEHARLRGLALSLLVIGLSAVAVILFISYFVANRAMAPVQASMDRQRRFVADASHELKTPLAVISMNAEAAKGSCDADEIAGNLANIEAETARMDGLVRNLLSLAKEEETKPVATSFDLSACAEDETGRVEAILFEKGIDFVFQKPAAPIIVKSDPKKLKTAIAVLLENAVKYTPAGGRVEVSVVSASGKTHPQIIVENTGAYLSPEDLSRIFDRFYRADKSHNSNTGGHGIGLAIAKETVQGLGGQIEAASKPLVGGGAVNKFVISL
ncbi:MAG: HAMP domain-containing histidine kinase [Clostridiales Family XIII bacterium]|jgi:signal transduction histidine kinase|nr:HAMP domain-containing histidine kinase [Clostridiales Family XIII bacterium]